MDEARAKAVFTAFKLLWERGLIYRGERLVNWCVKDGTALSDTEVEREERKGALYHIHYRREDGGEGLVVATTRPITIFGDTAVAVNPKDVRWKHMVGKNVLVSFIDRAIPVIEDSYVEFEFGTGALKVTPAHDQNDWEIGERHKLPAIKAIGPDGKLTEAAGPYAGFPRKSAGSSRRGSRSPRVPQEERGSQERRSRRVIAAGRSSNLFCRCSGLLNRSSSPSRP